MLLVNISLKFQIFIYNMPILFVEKKWEAFVLQKLLSFFQQKVAVHLDIKSQKYLTSWPLTELVNLTMLWTTGSRKVIPMFHFC